VERARAQARWHARQVEQDGVGLGAAFMQQHRAAEEGRPAHADGERARVTPAHEEAPTHVRVAGEGCTGRTQGPVDDLRAFDVHVTCRYLCVCHGSIRTGQ